MKKNAYIVYITVFFVILALPLAGLALPGSGESVSQAEKRDLAPLPSLVDADGQYNADWMGELGAWFEDHFGFRDSLITLHGLAEQAGIGSAAGDEVIVGRNGWLYYRGTLHDYLGRDLMSDRELFDAAHNLRLMQDYVHGEDCTFLFVIVPNKNSLYPEHMPAHYLAGGQSNAGLLGPYMEQAGVRSIDLHTALRDQQQTVYFERDTHWNGYGALAGYNEIMDALAVPHETYSGAGWTERSDHTGDLDEMLLPSAWTAETEYYLQTEFTFSYVHGQPASMRDPMIRTICDTGRGTLYMFRDSFGDALIPLFSQHFREASYSMYTPWNLPAAVETAGADVVIELVERNLTDLLNRPAVLPAPEREVSVSQGETTATTVKAVVDGPYVRVSGRIDEKQLKDRTQIAVRIGYGSEMHTFEPFYTSNEMRTGNSFCMYIPASRTQETICVEVCTGESFDDMHAVYSGDVRIESGG